MPIIILSINLGAVKKVSLQAIIKGMTGELRTKFVQSLFLDSKQYHVFNDVIIPLNSMSTQIDHVIVSKYGIFVVETKNKDGWIYGRPYDERWTQVIYKKKYQFQNPLRQNYLHTKSLAEFLGINHSKIHSMVIFWGKCQFKTQMPENVLNNKRIDYIKSKKEILLTNEEVDKICFQLRCVKKIPHFSAVGVIQGHLGSED